jgi:hypothetical protein
MMNMNLVGIAGTPAGMGACPCAGGGLAAMGAYARPVGADDTASMMPTSAAKIVPVVVIAAVVGLALWSIMGAARMEGAI